MRVMAELKVKFSKKFDVIKVIYSKPSLTQIIDVLHEASDTFNN